MFKNINLYQNPSLFFPEKSYVLIWKLCIIIFTYANFSYYPKIKLFFFFYLNWKTTLPTSKYVTLKKIKKKITLILFHCEFKYLLGPNALEALNSLRTVAQCFCELICAMCNKLSFSHWAYFSHWLQKTKNRGQRWHPAKENVILAAFFSFYSQSLLFN